MIIAADARSLPIRSGTVHCIVSSPPYFKQRDYGHALQVGQEDTADAYVAAIVDVGRECMRVLRADGTMWINIGDKYHDGELLRMPWRVATALVGSGWRLVCDVVWSKPNPRPESTRSRPTISHEYVFLLARSRRYYYDADAIREPLSDYYANVIKSNGGVRPLRPNTENFSKQKRQETGARAASTRAARAGFVNPLGRNKRSVWTFAAAAYAGDHYAPFPLALPTTCIMAGTNARGVCAQCGTPFNCACESGTRPALVLDPFVGTGTTGQAAEKLGRRWIGTDLSYHAMSLKRTAQRGLRFGDSE